MAAKAKKEYGNESISTLKGADRVRKRPGVIFGSDGLEGCEHSVFEILSNAIDEARQGYGKKIITTRYADGSVEVQDFGRGCPVDYNPKEQRYNWELVFCELYAGGKYDGTGDGNYEYALGLNGLGSCATQYSSEYMDVEVLRDGKRYNLHFEKGENIGGLKSEPYTGRQTGTRIRWKPDLEVFTDIAIPREYYTDVLKRQAVVNPGVEFLLRDQQEKGFAEETFCYQNGIRDYCEELAGENPLTPVQYWTGERTGRDREDKEDYRVKLGVALCFSNRVNITEYYHNSSFLEHGGSPERAVKVALVNQIDAWLKNNNKYLKNESKISFQDVQDCLVLVSSSFSTQTSYENQTKKSITNQFIYECMTEFLKHQMEVYFIENPDDAAKIGEQVLINKRSRENAEKTRLNLKKKLAGSIDLANRVEKFVDCRSRDTSRREIYIVEGDSAGGSAKMGRDSKIQAILPLWGKMLNVEKARIDKIYGNDKLTPVVTALGCGLGEEFDVSKLRYHKVFIMADADVDGSHICTLLLTFFFRYMRPLIEGGYVYIAQPPLFKLQKGKQVRYAYNEPEMSQISAEMGQGTKVSRYKGLGEMNPEQLWETTMDPEHRVIVQITIEDAMAADEAFTILMGDKVEPRKEFIERNAQYANLDV